jgi:hypothetical protein
MAARLQLRGACFPRLVLLLTFRVIGNKLVDQLGRLSLRKETLSRECLASSCPRPAYFARRAVFLI